MIVKKRRNRKNCVHYKPKVYIGLGGTQECSAKLSTWHCKGVSCGWYKEKVK